MAYRDSFRSEAFNAIMYAFPVRDKSILDTCLLIILY